MAIAVMVKGALVEGDLTGEEKLVEDQGVSSEPLKMESIPVGQQMDEDVVCL
ncbi:hypothetical protein SCP_0805170 [Sparassis crispa]|uniref:Uncharacterized protein n=1 Tax=Sparassis crispa TaxID=139825 RepID=A0A401GUX6_9APHY|nr:hypothetical protein SCP_0805170 [Sparassis crispa]GBE85993.1 hypothetical protein SCP_0805170 [Sparassis crispa]